MEDFISQFIQDLIPSAIKRLGAFIRWVFFRNKYSYKEVLEQNWNGRIGVLFIILIVVLIMT